jgi:RNA polymerase sigma-70 factor (ECF subfamily)
MADGERTADDRDERRLIARIAARDRAAFDVFYGRYAARVLAFVRDIVGSAELAEEAAGDAMIAVWRSAPTFGDRSRVSTWVLAIAHHKALDAVRRRGHATVPFDDLAQRLPHDPDPADELVRAEDRSTFERAIGALSPEHRTVLQLMFGFECSQAEIAAIVGCPVATVKTRAFYAKRRLREQLDRTAAEELA